MKNLILTFVAILVLGLSTNSYSVASSKSNQQHSKAIYANELKDTKFLQSLKSANLQNVNCQLEWYNLIDGETGLAMGVVILSSCDDEIWIMYDDGTEQIIRPSCG